MGSEALARAVEPGPGVRVCDETARSEKAQLPGATGIQVSSTTVSVVAAPVWHLRRRVCQIPRSRTM